MRRLNYTLVPERPLDAPVYRKGWRPIKPRPRPYPRPAASVEVAAVLAARRRLREDARPMAFQDNFSLVIAGYVPEYWDHMEVDATGPFLTPVASNTTFGNSNSLPHSVATVPDNDIPFNGALPDIQIIVGYVPEFSETMEVDWEGPSIPSGNPLGMTEVQYHPVYNGPPYASPQVMAENVFAPHLGIAGSPYNPVINGPLHVQAALNAFPPNAGLVNPPYDPRETLFHTRPLISHLNAGIQVVESNVFVGINVNPPAPTYSAQPCASKTLNAPAVVIEGEHPDDRGQLFNELFGNDGEEEDEDEDEDEGAGIAPDPPWGGGRGDDLVGEHGSDEDEDEHEVEIII